MVFLWFSYGFPMVFPAGLFRDRRAVFDSNEGVGSAVDQVLVTKNVTDEKRPERIMKPWDHGMVNIGIGELAS